MRTVLVGYATALVTFVAVDAVWLGMIAREFYRVRMGGLLLDQPQLVPAAAFYLLYPVGLTVFALTPALETQSWAAGLWRGALLGLIAYGTYDLTALAVIRGWSMPLALVDMAWGAVLSGAAVVASYAAVRAWAE